MEGQFLRVTGGNAAGSEIPLDDGLLIGRSVGGDGGLGGDPELSREHANIKWAGVQLLIEDLGSTNGTFVNGERITEATPIRPGDAIGIGASTLEVAGTVPAAADPTLAAAARRTAADPTHAHSPGTWRRGRTASDADPPGPPPDVAGPPPGVAGPPPGVAGPPPGVAGPPPGVAGPPPGVAGPPPGVAGPPPAVVGPPPGTAGPPPGMGGPPAGMGGPPPGGCRRPLPPACGSWRSWPPSRALSWGSPSPRRYSTSSESVLDLQVVRASPLAEPRGRDPRPHLVQQARKKPLRLP